MPGVNTEQRRLAAIMFTDMVGYSAMSQSNEALALELLEEHRSLLRSLFPKHQGTEIKTIGDGFLVEFASAVAAVRCAVEIQQSLAERNRAQVAERHVCIRIGIHVGDVVRRSGDVDGDGVNIAARIEPLAESGGICISNSVHDQVENKIEQGFVQLSRPDLKNISANVKVYKLVLDDTISRHSKSGIRKHSIKWSLFAFCVAGMLALTSLIVPKGFIRPKPRVRAELRLLIGGFELSVINEGETLAQGINVDIAAWQCGSPGIEFQTSYPVRDLSPHGDYTILSVFGHIISAEADEVQNLFWRRKHGPISGYFCVSWRECTRPRAWAFYVPSRGRPRYEIESSVSRDKMEKFSGSSRPWPLIEFLYPEEKPRIGQCVDYPRGVLLITERPFDAWVPKATNGPDDAGLPNVETHRTSLP